MRIIRILVVFWLSIGLMAPQASADTLHKDVRIGVQKSQSGKWVIDIAFPRPQNAMMFIYSANGHHAKSWTPISAGTQIKTVKGLDVMVFDAPTKTARFTLEPQSFVKSRSLIPARKFNDGNIAFFTGEFLMVPVLSAGEVARFGGNIRNWRGTPLKHTLLVVAPDTNILTDGQSFSGIAKLSFNQTNSGYVFVGDNQFVETAHYKAILDKTLPQWLRARFEGDYERVLARLTQLWGRGLDEKPTILFNVAHLNRGPHFFSGLETGGDQLVLEIGGAAYKEPRPDLITRFYELIAHETAHLFQGQNGLRSSSEVAWILEGVANVMARDVLFKEGLINDEDVQSRYSDSYGTCIKTLGGGMSRQSGRFYDCGEIMALIADKAMGDKTLYDAWNLVLKKTKNKAFTNDRYFKSLRSMGARGDHVSVLKKIAEQKLQEYTLRSLEIDHSETLKQLMIDVGLNPQFDSAGTLLSLDWQA